MEEKNQKKKIPVSIIQKNGEIKNFPSVASAAKFCDVNTHTIFYAIKKGKKNKFKGRKDRTFFQVFKIQPTLKTDDDKETNSFLQNGVSFPDSWKKRDKIDYYDIKSTTDREMKLCKTLNFLDSRPESYFSQIRNMFDDNPFDCDPPRFSNS